MTVILLRRIVELRYYRVLFLSVECDSTEGAFFFLPGQKTRHGWWSSDTSIKLGLRSKAAIMIKVECRAYQKVCWEDLRWIQRWRKAIASAGDYFQKYHTVDYLLLKLYEVAFHPSWNTYEPLGIISGTAPSLTLTCPYVLRRIIPRKFQSKLAIYNSNPGAKTLFSSPFSASRKVYLSLAEMIHATAALCC